MPTFLDISKKFDINFNTILNDIFKAQNIHTWVLNAIRKRLYDKGETGSGNILKTDSSRGGNPYSDVTMDIKDFHGQKISNVTLKDSGEFYNSFRMALNLFGFELSGDFQKTDGHIAKNFTNQYGSEIEFENDVMSLTDQEIDQLIKNDIIPMIFKKLNEKV